jgi:hypothetical protein
MSILEFLFGTPYKPQREPIPVPEQQQNPENRPKAEFPLGTYRIYPTAQNGGAELGWGLERYSMRGYERISYYWSIVMESNSSYRPMFFESEELAEQWVKDELEKKEKLLEHLKTNRRNIPPFLHVKDSSSDTK